MKMIGVVMGGENCQRYESCCGMEKQNLQPDNGRSVYLLGLLVGHLGHHWD